jgi:predicted small secreted protein
MKVHAWWLVVLLLLTQAACNTTRGLGQDIEAAGRAVGDLAQETEEELED